MNIPHNCCLVQACPQAKLSVGVPDVYIFCYWGTYWESTGQGPHRELNISNMEFVLRSTINQCDKTRKRRVSGSFLL